jgi:hypothetical protein
VEKTFVRRKGIKTITANAKGYRMSIQTGVLTPIQMRDKTIKDLKIRMENAKIKAEITEAELREENAIQKRALSDKDKIIAMLQHEIVSLTRENEELRSDKNLLKQSLDVSNETIQKLMLIMGKNSSNSSKPPGSNGYRKIPNNREKSQRPLGAPKGHPGHCLKLPENLDELVENGHAEKRLIDHTNGSEEYVSRWVLDIEVKTVVTEHRFPKSEVLPKGMKNEVTYGDNIKAITVLLSNEGIIADERLADFINELTYGALSPSDATIESFLRQFANKLPEELKSIEENLLENNVMHADDTSVDCTEKPEYGNEAPVLKTSENTSFTVCFRTYSNEQSTLYTVNPRKDQAGVDRDGILPKYKWTVCHDHESKFYNYGTAHGTCCGHLTRDLKGLHELGKCQWADRMRLFMIEMNKHKNADLKNNINACEEKLLHEYENQYDALLAEGREVHGALMKKELGENDLKNMLARLSDYKNCYLLFMRDYNVPFTNNLAERDLRIVKTQQKVSGCFRSWEGLKNYAQNMSFISTVKKRGKNLFNAITDIFKGIPVFAKNTEKQTENEHQILSA